MLLSEFGSMLRQRREEQNIAVVDIVNKLKLPKRIVLALEEGDAESLPHVSYIRSFLKSYALLLGFSQEEIEEALHSLDDAQEEVKTPVSMEVLHADSHPAVHHGGFRLLIQLLLIGAAGVGGYMYYTGSHRAEPEAPSAVTPAPSQPASPSAGKLGLPKTESPMPAWGDKEAGASISSETPAVGNTSGSASGTVSGAASGTTSGTASPLSEKNQPMQNPSAPIPSSPQSSGQPSAQLSAQSASQPFAQSGVQSAQNSTGQNLSAQNSLAQVQKEEELSAPLSGHEARIVAQEDCWIEAIADKKMFKQILLKKGETLTVPFVDSANLKLGNPGGITLYQDGKQVEVKRGANRVPTVVLPIPKAAE